ncbi:MAG: universal stress protein, partial [Rhizobiales bacterium]|nr:universal stress protein [Hyphomicrobiales bacterium]
MIKDILVHIPTERSARPVIDASISLGSAFRAHIDAFAIGYVSVSSAYVIDGSAAAAVASVFEAEQARAAERASAALDHFEAEARKANVAYHCHPSADMPSGAAASICAAARLCDLAVVLQPESNEETFDNRIPQEIL